MNKPALVCFCLFAAVSSQAVDLKQSKVTQVVNEVQIISAAAQQQKPAAVNDIFAMPDILRTGAASRAELVAQDQTVTRVGANTIFSFDPENRALDLKQGSLLFHAPHGKGGGTIHTGSATASVLGTTLIVVTTPNGGFKVIDLEGQVEVTLTNNLRQKLSPGQMTFVLPGANQLAPIVLFRLDQLVQNSLLVKGFAQTLTSLPLIQDQINTQQKQISSGKLGDTGLLVGNDANPNQVEVLDLNTISGGQNGNPPPPQQQANSGGGGSYNPPPPPPPAGPSLADAEAADAIIDQSSLTDSSLPTPPQHVYFSFFNLPDIAYFNGQLFSGFAARNIYFEYVGGGGTPEARDESALTVDLSSYSGRGMFDMVAVSDIDFYRSVWFSGLKSSDSLGLIAGDAINLTSGITLEADVKNFQFSAPASMIFDNITLNNNVGDINLDTAGDLSLVDGTAVNNLAGRLIISTGGNVSTSSSQINAGSLQITSVNGGITILDTAVTTTSHVTLIATGDITIGTQDNYGETVTPNSKAPRLEYGYGSSLVADKSSGSVTVISSAGSVNISSTQIATHYLTLQAANSILLDCYGRTPTTSGTGTTANLTGGNGSVNGQPDTIAVYGTDFTGFSTVNMAANTINLTDVQFGAGSQVSLRSFSGQLAPNPNTGAASVPGDVNFIYNVTYAGQPAQNYIGNGITIGKY